MAQIAEPRPQPGSLQFNECRHTPGQPQPGLNYSANSKLVSTKKHKWQRTWCWDWEEKMWYWDGGASGKNISHWCYCFIWLINYVQTVALIKWMHSNQAMPPPLHPQLLDALSSVQQNFETQLKTRNRRYNDQCPCTLHNLSTWNWEKMETCSLPSSQCCSCKWSNVPPCDRVCIGHL